MATGIRNTSSSRSNSLQCEVPINSNPTPFCKDPDILSASDGISVAPGSVSQKDRETIRETVRMYAPWNDVDLEQLVLSTLPWINAHNDGPNGIIRKTAIGGYFSEHPEI